ncbi:MAG: hypothetical protein AAGG68_27755 [Bacteroidota bacterium]
MKKIKQTALLLAASYLLWTNYLLQINSTVFGVLAGICFGVVFFLLADMINRRLINKKIACISLHKGEEIILAEPSNYYIGTSKGRGALGKLFLTNRRLVFQKQAVLAQKATPPIEIYLRKIDTVEDYNRAMLPTGITVRLKDKKEFTFALDDRVVWKEALCS